jgi:DMSO/TMAO reductase YedYZ molybdopterin-dependent catalytic subunit
VTAAGLDRLLAVLVVALAATGLLSLRAGAPSEGWLFLLHGLLGGALAVTVAWKVRRSMPRAIRARRWGRVALGGFVSLATAAALVGGFAWVASGELLSIGSWTVLTLHAWIGLALVPVLVIHLLPRRWRLLTPRRRAASGHARVGPAVSRRQVLAAGTIAMASVGFVGAAQLAETVRGGERRFTGSRWLASGGIPPATTFFGEPPPPAETVDPATWRLRVHGAVERELALSTVDLEALEQVDTAPVLDCTSGWAIETGWRGASLAGVLERAGVDPAAHEVVVRSITGWGTVLPLAEARTAVLAQSVAGQPLPVGNGAPCRLVVPDRRGLDWVKWVSEVEVR